jgi:2,4-dienoyl-CoA reductase (NADPH2)
MTTVAYCAVAPDGRTFRDQLHMRPELVPDLRALTAAVHAGGAAASLQLGHCGAFCNNHDLERRRPVGPSRALNLVGALSGRVLADAMTEGEIEEVTAAFVTAARLAREAGFDAVELHLGHGYLLSQFLSPGSNARRDRFGGSLENRARFPLSVVERVRAALPPEDFVAAWNSTRACRWRAGWRLAARTRWCSRADSSAAIPSTCFAVSGRCAR